MTNEESFEDRLNRWTLEQLKIELTKKNIYGERKLNRIETRIAELTYGENNTGVDEIVESRARMKVFLSWSGEASHTVASLLRDWLPTVLPQATTWVSSLDIDKGARWSTEIAVELESSNFGIICVVPGNLNAPWLNYEAGAISKSLALGRVAPFAVGIRKVEIAGPLSQFQITEFDREDVFRLVQSINRASEQPQNDNVLLRNFNICWASLENGISGLELSERIIEPNPENGDEQSLDQTTASILEVFFDSSRNISLEDICSSLGLERGIVSYHFDLLQDRNFIQQATVGRSVTWGRGASGESPATFRITPNGRKYVVEILRT